MFDQPLVDSMKGIVGKIGVNPNRFENMAASYSDALDFDELGTVAMALDTDDPITGATTYGIANGRTAVGGLGSDLGQGWLDLELGELILVRDRIRTAIPIVDTLTKFVKGKIDALTKPGKNSYESIAKRLYDDAKKAYDDLQDKIGTCGRRSKKLEGISKPTDEQKQRLTDLKGRLNGLVNALGVAKQIMDDSKFRVGAVGDVAGAFGARVTALDAVKVALKTGGAEDGSWPSLEELQGRTGAAGSIFDTQLEITEHCGRPASGRLSDVGEKGTVRHHGEASALQELNAELLRQQLEEQRRLTAIAEAQTPRLRAVLRPHIPQRRDHRRDRRAVGRRSERRGHLHRGTDGGDGQKQRHGRGRGRSGRSEQDPGRRQRRAELGRRAGDAGRRDQGTEGGLPMRRTWHSVRHPNLHRRQRALSRRATPSPPSPIGSPRRRPTAYTTEEGFTTVTYPVTSGAEGEVDVWVPPGSYRVDLRRRHGR